MAEQSLFTPEEFKKFKKSKGVKRGKQEENIQLAVCAYIKENYPDVIFFCDMSSGMKMPIWLAARNKKMRSSKALPDLFIAKPFLKNTRNHTLENGYPCVDVTPVESYSGLFIELKREDVRLKNGSIASSPHHDEQAIILSRLMYLGYRAEFACGYDEAIKLIDDYLK